MSSFKLFIESSWETGLIWNVLFNIIATSMVIGFSVPQLQETLDRAKAMTKPTAEITLELLLGLGFTFFILWRIWK